MLNIEANVERITLQSIRICIYKYMMKEKNYIVYLHSSWVSQRELTDIFSIEKSPKDFFEGLCDNTLWKYIQNHKRRKEILQKFKEIDRDTLEKVINKLQVQIIILWEQKYPASLKNIPHTPYILYVRWEIPKWDMFWIVGSRSITSYGKKVIQKITPDIAKIFPVVSWGAAGCDTEAHKITLDSWWKTVVVIGTGIDQTYPVGNEALFNKVVEKWWAVISIFRISEPGNPYNFPMRNEIVVWLSRGVLVVEAKWKSGSLITAWLCLDWGKDLFAIPGDITLSSSLWTNRLIQKWEAKSVIDAVDILEEYEILIKQSLHKKQLPLLSEIESKIYNHISKEICDIDTLHEKVGANMSELTMHISLLELKKLIKKDMSGNYGLM